MELLERDRFLHALSERLNLAAAGRGAVVVAGGEAGIGKTSLLEAFAGRALSGRARSAAPARARSGR